MTTRRLQLPLGTAVALTSFLLGISCSDESASDPINGGSGGSAPASGGLASKDGAPTTGGTARSSGGLTASGGGSSSAGGSRASGGTVSSSGGISATGGSNGGAPATPTGGKSTTGAAGTSGGAAGAPSGGSGGAVTPPPPPPLDCGEQGWAVENHGPPKNRVNYLILGDGYTEQTVETTLKSHIETMLERRFEHESGEPYGRYRKFVNICVMKAISRSDGIGNGETAFDGGNGGDRLAAVNENKVNEYIKASVPASFEVDWKAVVLNQNKWENTGSFLMLWSGAHADAAGAALHEGGHGFHQLADEYGSQTGCGNQKASCGAAGKAYQEVNTAGNCQTTDHKWDLWLGSTQKGMKVPDEGATGVQGTWLGSRYVGEGQYRPSCNSMMNSLFGMNVNTSFNSVSREQIVFSIWRAVVPIDSTEPPEGAVSDPGTLTVHVIDPEVISVDWTVGGETLTNAGTTFSTASLASGTHTITAKAYDNATEELVRLRTGKCPTSVTGRYCHGSAWTRSTQTVTWTVTKP